MGLTLLFSFRFVIKQNVRAFLCHIQKVTIHCGLSGVVFIRYENMWPLVRIYRGGFLLIQFLFLLGINTYGWRQAGVNHVLIFEINPRNNLSHQHLFEVRMKKQMETIISAAEWETRVPRNRTHRSPQGFSYSLEIYKHKIISTALFRLLCDYM